MTAFTVRPWRLGYAVWNGDDRVTGVIGNIGVAERTADMLAIKNRAKPRRCLCCGETFNSSGPGNRLCDPCRQYAARIAV